uniref:Uncharacterized protein n=1 Tax=Pipistrellus kuhlii TaxID=59472 RepID=A0A7J8A951_PIPKU|nr:hypothetical protein mPipKuh1_008855 [Pipistrellus kuhlii]
MMTYSFHPPLHPSHRLSAPSPSWIREGGRKNELNGHAPEAYHPLQRRMYLTGQRVGGWMHSVSLARAPACWLCSGRRQKSALLPVEMSPRPPPSITQRPTMSASLRPPPGPPGAQHKRPVVGQQPRQQASLWVTHNLAISFVWSADPCWKPACACPTRVGALAGLSSITPRGREPPPPWTCMPFR